MNAQVEKRKFDSIEGLRTIACIGIVLMHIKANIGYTFPNNHLIKVISEFTNFVYLFMVISSFGICCGYFNKIKNKEISPELFYSKRINKILPFFLFLIIIDLIINHNVPTLIEGFADATLLFGFLQKDIEVIGVAWFLGLVFIFYIMFPYFTYLYSNKKRAWITTITAMLMNLSCVNYFDVGRTNMFYSFFYFSIGGLIFIYKDSIIKKIKGKRIIGILLIISSIILYFIIPMNNEYLMLPRMTILSTTLVCYAISNDSYLLNNKITKFIGNISFEIYLSHMVIFRIFEKLNLIHISNNLWISYVITSFFVIVGTIALSILYKKIYYHIKKKVYKNENFTCK